jgi:hypothetical protein
VIRNLFVYYTPRPGDGLAQRLVRRMNAAWWRIRWGPPVYPGPSPEGRMLQNLLDAINGEQPKSESGVTYERCTFEAGGRQFTYRIEQSNPDEVLL